MSALKHVKIKETSLFTGGNVKCKGAHRINQIAMATDDQTRGVVEINEAAQKLSAMSDKLIGLAQELL
jgi:hypothetical protein